MQRALTYLGISMGVSLAAAMTFVIVLTLTLPESDAAHGQMPFADPLVFPVMIVGVTISGLIGWPFFAVFGWRVSPVMIARTTAVVVLGFIILVTPFNAKLGWFGSYIVCLLTLAFCHLFRSRPPVTAGTAKNSRHDPRPIPPTGPRDPASGGICAHEPPGLPSRRKNLRLLG